MEDITKILIKFCEDKPEFEEICACLRGDSSNLPPGTYMCDPDAYNRLVNRFSEELMKAPAEMIPMIIAAFQSKEHQIRDILKDEINKWMAIGIENNNKTFYVRVPYVMDCSDIVKDWNEKYVEKKDDSNLLKKPYYHYINEKIVNINKKEKQNYSNNIWQREVFDTIHKQRKQLKGNVFNGKSHWKSIQDLLQNLSDNDFNYNIGKNSSTYKYTTKGDGEYCKNRSEVNSTKFKEINFDDKVTIGEKDYVDSLIYFLKSHGIGVDCSGFVTRMLADVMTKLGATDKEKQETIGYDNKNKVLVTNCTKITGGKLKKMLIKEIKDLKPGDILLKNTEGFHTKLVYDVGKDKNGINYYRTAESSPTKSPILSKVYIGPETEEEREEKEGSKLHSGIRLQYHITLDKEYDYCRLSYFISYYQK